MIDDAQTAQARRYYHHVANGGKLTKCDVGRMVEYLESRDARIAELTGERDRQYEQNAEFIAKIAKLEAALDEAVQWNWIDHEEGADDPHSLSRIPECISGPILALINKDQKL